MKPITAPVAAEVRQDKESEAALIREAKQVISTSSWKLGEIASRWTATWARGRTDADFGAAVGMTGDQVNQRRRVWDRFGNYDTYRNLSWSHFYAAVTWDDADACLEWACANQATVAEMKAWRTAKTGEQAASGGGGDNVAPGDPFGSEEDPFGEGAEGAGKETGGAGTDADGEDGGKEPEGTESEEEQSTRPPRSGKDRSGGSEKSPQELFAEYKAKTVKTLEAGMRVIDDANGVKKVPQHDSMIKALGKMIDTVRTW